MPTGVKTHQKNGMSLICAIKGSNLRRAEKSIDTNSIQSYKTFSKRPLMQSYSSELLNLAFGLSRREFCELIKEEI